jgi:hypothetical protein
LGQRPRKQQVTHIIQPEGLKEIKDIQAFTKLIGLSFSYREESTLYIRF